MEMMELKHKEVFTRLTELTELATKESLTHACRILNIPKKEAEPIEERLKRIKFASEVFNRVPQGCLWRRKADEVKEIAKAVSVKARGKKVGIEALEAWHLNIVKGFIKAKEKTSYKRELLKLYKQKLPIPFELALNVCGGNSTTMHHGYCYVQGDVCYDHSKGRDHIWHSSMRDEAENLELQAYGAAVDNPLDYILRHGLDSSEEFKAYCDREKDITNYEAAPSLLRVEFDNLIKIMDCIPECMRNGVKVDYFNQMKWMLYFNVNELRKETFQLGLF